MKGSKLLNAFILIGLLLIDWRHPALAESADQHEFFESKVRPLLSAHCYECHSGRAESPKGGLRLDARTHLISGGDSGPAVVPGAADESLLVSAIRWDGLEMPPKGRLSDDQIVTLERWVEMGAPWPDPNSAQIEKTAGPVDWRQRALRHWAFQPMDDPPPPQVSDPKWAKTPLDRFVLARLEAAGLQPAPRAAARTLVRRICFDLTGIPPTPSEVKAFERTSRHDFDLAVDQLVDRLLASPQHGERWARHWLDIARYSDVDGGGSEHGWRYRDWVADSLNRDLPFDEFVVNQIAGDLTGDYRDSVGTGFFALGPRYNSDGGDPDSIAQAKGETLDDRVDTFSRGLIGLTVSCARCHDHKFDPIPQIDYYSIAGVFENSSQHQRPLADPDVVTAVKSHQESLKRLREKLKQQREQLKKEKREPTERERKEADTWQQEIEQFESSAPQPYAVATTLTDRGSADMPVAIRGNLLRPGETAPRRFLQALTDEDDGSLRDGSGRKGLALAVASAENPLTTRVFVNRVWMHHFAKALVRTPSNFGTLGEQPTHPQLLDWLACRLIGSGWSIKHLHRLIMTSATYQMSSQGNQAAFDVDADNRLLWRMNSRRLDVESWRDSLLTVSGRLDSKIGGPSVDSVGSPRRTLYLRVSRNGDQFDTDRFLRLFDFPLMRATVAARPQSTVPPQYLFLMNNPLMVDLASQLVDRIHRQTSTDEAGIDWVYQLLFSRAATKTEKLLGLRFIQQATSPDEKPQARWIRYAQVLLTSNEFMYVR